MEPEIREYSGFLTYRRLDTDGLSELRRVVANSGLQVDAEPEATEIEYAGRDTNRKVVRLLADIAEIVRDADGEVICRTDQDDGDPQFEFYAIRGGHLLRQRAHLVREAAEVVTPAQREAHQVA
jgi:hypothetical protein